MPIRPDLRHHYGKQWKAETRPAALDRAGHQCEHCHKPNHALIETVSYVVQEFDRKQYEMYWRPATIKHGDTMPAAAWITREGRPLYFALFNRPARFVVVVLTVAHLNQVAGDDRPENLRALCQWCHLIYDLEQHHRTRADRKDQGRPLLSLCHAIESSPTI